MTSAARPTPHDHPPTGTCTRADLAERLHELGFSRRDSRRLVGGVFDAIAEALADEEPVKLRNFGRFQVADRAPRQGRDLATGSPVAVPARTDVVFHPAAHLRDALGQALSASGGEP